jgi:hypothetical protein
MRQVLLKREVAADRNAIANDVLGNWLQFHRWLPLPAGRSLIALVAQAAQAGITLAPLGALQQIDRGTLGIRLCLGHPKSDDELRHALVMLRRILESAEEMSFFKKEAITVILHFMEPIGAAGKCRGLRRQANFKQRYCACRQGRPSSPAGKEWLDEQPPVPPV